MYFPAINRIPLLQQVQLILLTPTSEESIPQKNSPTSNPNNPYIKVRLSRTFRYITIRSMSASHSHQSCLLTMFIVTHLGGSTIRTFQVSWVMFHVWFWDLCKLMFTFKCSLEFVSSRVWFDFATCIDLYLSICCLTGSKLVR